MLGLLSGSLMGAVKPREQKDRGLPAAGEFVRFADPTTETTVVRLTTPSYSSVLPSPRNRFVSLKPRFLLCSSDRGGVMAPFQVDLRTGAVKQIANAAKLDASSPCLDGASHAAYFLDGTTLQEVALGGRRNTSEIAENVSAFSIGKSRSELFVISAGRLQQVAGRDAAVLADGTEAPCVARPGGGGCLFGRTGSRGEPEYWYADVARPGKPVLVARGLISNPFWSASGETVLFLRQTPVNNALVSEVHEVNPVDGTERLMSRTSQFAAFSPNGNDSVFVGASSSRAQPNVILLLSSIHREMTLCEHRSSRPADVRPTFSPDSRRVYFQSDREGKPALYSVNVESLIEPTQPLLGTA